jgi:amidase
MGWFSLRTEGPMGRTVADAALLLSVQAGPDPRSPIDIPEPGRRFREPLGRDFKGVRVAWSRNFGYLPVEESITAVFDSQREAFEALGCIVEDAEPDIRGAIEAFKVLRAWRYSLEHGERIKAHRAEMNENLVWNTEEGFKLSGLDVARAEAARTEVYHRVREFLERYEYLITPVNPTPPLPIEQRTIKEIDGVKMGDYVDGAALKNSISLIGNPAIAVPAGFTPDGLPVGLQIIGRHHADFEVLQLAHAYEQATGVGKTRPPLDD